MKKLIHQAMPIVLYFFIPTTLAGILSEGYSSISQHASEISITKFETAKTIFSLGEILTGLSLILLALGCLLNVKVL